MRMLATSMSARFRPGWPFPLLRPNPLLASLLGLIALLCGRVECSAGPVMINEIHHSPVPRQQPLEFVELFNSGTNAVELSGWRLSGGVDFVLPTPTTIPASGFVVVAEDPAALTAAYGVKNPLGPWLNSLGGTADTVTLRDASGAVIDEVAYQNGFPWPLVGMDQDSSIELVNPSLDNSLGGSWRPSGSSVAPIADQPLINAGQVWRYRKGTAEASTPTTAWRATDFDDSGWSTGALPIGYDPSVSIATRLDDMRNTYRQVFLRKHFTANDAAAFTSLRLGALFDDGFKLWLNGRLLLAVNLPETEVAFDANSLNGAREDNSYATYDLALPAGVLRNGDNVLAVQLANVDLSSSSDAFFDASLVATARSGGAAPTPGRPNSVLAANAPPALRQVSAQPRQPLPGQAITLSVKATDPDGIASVTALYQVVEPGKYIELTSPEYATQWTPVEMVRSATDTNTFQVTLPAALSAHRNLIRYRFIARDTLGAEARAPYTEDPVPNFAVFCYGGVPEWRGAIHPGASGSNGAPFTVSAPEMNRLPVMHLISQSLSVATSTGWAPGKPNNQYTGDNYLWRGALVYDGEVYDHIRYRARGGVWRYSMGKNAWKFDFNPGHSLKMKDDFGRSYNATWDKLSFRPDIQQGDYDHRGEQGLFESVGYRLFQLAGVDANHTTHIQFRVIDEAAETAADSQFNGDFWGLYLAVEEQDGQFLKERGLPDGNIFDMEGGFGALNHIGKTSPSDRSDLSQFLGTYNSTNAPTESWWRTNLNLPSYYGYQTVVQAIHHYDIADGKNYFYYHNPVDNRWVVQPWDLDLTWADNMYREGVNGGDEPFKSRVLANFSITAPKYPALSLEFRNRVRELRDLLFNPDQAGAVIDEQARLIRGTNAASILDADRCQWDYNPIMTNTAITLSSKAGWGRFYQFPRESGISHSFAGAVQLMKNYLVRRSTMLDNMAAEPARPDSPSIRYTGLAGFPVNQLSFASSAYSGSASRASIKWRIAEISRPGHPAFRADEPMKFEIQSTWETDELTGNADAVSVPVNTLRPGRLYRARARFTDVAGRASNWSAPIEFTAGVPDTETLLARNLRITEVMYHPAADGFEFIELFNASPSETLNLAGSKFTAGISFTFPEGAQLAPSSFALLIKTADAAAFRAYYRVAAGVTIFGPYDGSLDNGGETVTLKSGTGAAPLITFSYSDQAPWPAEADGTGRSIVVSESGPEDPADPQHWRASTAIGGSAGTADTAPPAFRFDLPLRTSEGLLFHFRSEPDQTYTVETSTNALNWVPLLTHTGPLDYHLPVPPDQPRIFLRAQRTP